MKTIRHGLLFAGAFLALGLAARHHRGVVPAAVPSDQPAAIDAAVMSQVARAQAAAALSQTAGAASLRPFGF